MNKIYVIFLALCCMTTTTLLAQGGENISVHDFSNRLKKENRTNINLIDVRTPGEFNSGHLKQAANIDYNDRKFLMEVRSLDKNKPTYIYCRSGGRSAGAMEKMKAEGFTKIYNMEGGIKAWNAAHLPLSAPEGYSESGLSMKEFKKMVNQDVPVLVDFTASWCGPCKIMKPSVKKLAKTYPKDIKVIYIDVDQNKELVNEIGIQAMPTLHLYKKGRLSRKKVGLLSYQELKRFIR